MAEEMVIFTRTYDFISWLLPLAEKFPRSQRFVITQRLQNASLNFQEAIIEANVGAWYVAVGKTALCRCRTAKSSFIFAVM